MIVRNIGGRVQRIGMFGRSDDVNALVECVVMLEGGAAVRFWVDWKWQPYLAVVTPGDHVTLELHAKRTGYDWELSHANAPLLGPIEPFLANLIRA